MADLVRVIPICFVTGHAAGVAAAVAVKDGCRAARRRRGEGPEDPQGARGVSGLIRSKREFD